MTLFGLLGRRRSKDWLDDELGRLSKCNPFRVRDLMRSVAVWGATGSGKSTGPARWLAQSILGHPRSSMLILGAKPEDKGEWQKYFRQAGRAKDLAVFEPGGGLRFNVLDYILKSGGDYRDVTNCLNALSETMRSGDGTGKDEFWEEQQGRGTYNGVVMLKLGTGGISAPELQRFLIGVAQSPADLASDAWRDGYHNRTIRAAYQARKSSKEEADFEIAKDYFIHELPNMADKTRSSIFVGIFGLLHCMNTGEVRALLSADTNITPQAMLQAGKSVLVNLPPAEYGATGKLVNAAWKWATEWSVLRRRAGPGDFFNVIFSDEFQQYFNTPDSDYLAQSRSHLGCMVCLSQSKHAYYAALGERNKHKVDALLANFNLKIFNALGDAETARWASELVGRELRTFYGGSVAPSEGMWDTLMGNTKVTSSFSTSFENIVEPNVFMHGLRTGGPPGYLVDAMLVKTGEPFVNGANWMWTTFKQR